MIEAYDSHDEACAALATGWASESGFVLRAVVLADFGDRHFAAQKFWADCVAL